MQCFLLAGSIRTHIMNNFMMLHIIQQYRVIYDIHYCEAGVGIRFKDDMLNADYHDNIETAIAAEYYNLVSYLVNKRQIYGQS